MSAKITSERDFDGLLRLAHALLEQLHVRPLLAAHVIKYERLLEAAHLVEHFRFLISRWLVLRYRAVAKVRVNIKNIVIKHARKCAADCVLEQYLD